MTTTVTEAVYRMRVDGSAAVDAAARSVDGLAVSEEKLTRATRATEQGFERMMGRLDPAIRAHQQYQQALERVEKFTAAGIGTDSERARAIEIITQRYQQALGAINKHTQVTNDNAKASGLARHELVNLGRQAQDVGTMLAMGAAPMQVFTSQAAQIFDIFSSSQGTLRGFFGQVTSGLAAIVTPARLAFGGIIAGAGAAVLALNSYLEGQKSVERALRGIGRASGMTATGINAVAQSVATPFGLSVSEAREFGAALAATGRIGREELSALVKLGHDFAIAIGTDSKGAAEALAKSLSDPIRGADELNQRFGFMDAAQRRSIQNLVEQNRIAEAQRIIIAGIQSSIEGASEATGFWSKTWTAISNAISNAWDGLGKILARATGIGQNLDDQYAKAKSRLEELQKIRDAQSGDDAFSVAARRVRGGVIGNENAKYEEAVENERKLKKALEDRAAAAEAARQRMASLQIASAAMDFLPEIRQLDQLKNAQDLLVRTMIEVQTTGGPASEILKRLGLTYEQLAAALAKANAEIKDFATQNQRAAAQAKIAQDAVTAYSPGARADIARRFALEQNRGNPESETRAQEAYTLALRQATEAIREQKRERKLAAEQNLAAANLELSLVGKGIAEQTRARLDLQAKHQLEQDAARNRIAFDQAEYERLKKINAELGEKAKLRALSDLRSDIQFAGDTTFFSDIEKQIASIMRQIHGDDWQNMMQGPEASAMRFQVELSGVVDLVKEFGKEMFVAFLTGKDGTEAMIRGLEKMAAKLADKAFQDALMAAATMDPAMAAKAGAEAIGAFALTAFANDLKLKKAREEWEKAGPAFEKFISTLSGGMQGAISQQFEQLRSQAEQFIDKAFKAGDFGAINRVLTAFSDAVIRETNAFRESFEGMLAGLEGGLGPSSPFASAAQRIKSITDELQGFIDDARISFANDPIALAAGNNPLIAGGGETQVRSATEAAQQYLLSLLGAKPELSATATAIQEMQGTAVALRAALVELGMTSDQAAAAISAGVTAAMSELASKFSNDLQREINDALGQGYLNEFADLMKRRQQALDDAARLGTGTALVDRWFQVSAQKIINDAGLAGSAIASLVALFPELGGVVKDSNAALRAAVEAAEAEVERARSALEQAYQREVSALDSVISRMKSFIDQFTKFRDSLWLNQSLSVLSPQQRLLEAQRQFRDVAALAAQGDETALGKLQDVSQAYLDEAKSFYASTEQYYAAFMEVQGVLEAAEDAANRQLSTAQQQLSALNQQVAGLIAINNSVLSVEAAINNLMLAQSNLAAAMANLNNARDWGLRPEINKLLVSGLSEHGINYTGNFGAGEFGAWLGGQSQSVRDILAQIERTIPQSLVDFYSKVAPFQPAYASGTDFHPGGLAWVGEQGRELVNLPRGSQVIPNDILRGFAGRGGADNRELVAEVKALRQEVAALRGDTRAGAVHVREGVDQAANRTERVSAAARQQANRPRGYGTRGAA